MDYLHVQADNPWYNYYLTHDVCVSVCVPAHVLVGVCQLVLLSVNLSTHISIVGLRTLFVSRIPNAHKNRQNRLLAVKRQHWHIQSEDRRAVPSGKYSDSFNDLGSNIMIQVFKNTFFISLHRSEQN